jgi:hypothetical protein
MVSIFKRRWFRFSLRTLVIVVPMVFAASYWAYRDYAARSARAEFEGTFEAVEAQTATHEQLFAASDYCLQAALAVPFADKKRIYTEYLDDLARMCERWLLWIQTANPQWHHVESLNETDRRYADGYQQVRVSCWQGVRRETEGRARADAPPGRLSRGIEIDEDSQAIGFGYDLRLLLWNAGMIEPASNLPNSCQG